MARERTPSKDNKETDKRSNWQRLMEFQEKNVFLIVALMELAMYFVSYYEGDYLGRLSCKFFFIGFMALHYLRTNASRPDVTIEGDIWISKEHPDKMGVEIMRKAGENKSNETPKES